MKKNIITTILFLLLFSGCSEIEKIADDPEKYFQGKILETSGVQGTEDYQLYRELKDSGKLNQEGLYDLASAGYETEVPGTIPPIRVTFAENRYLSINYYRDPGRTIPVDTENCRLHPGDTIYTSKPISINPHSNLFVFDKLQVIRYSDDGERTALYDGIPTAEGLEIRIPADTEATELSVEVMGHYQNRVLTFTDYIVDEKGKKHELDGEWRVNDQKIVGSSVEISPIASYTVSYSYPGKSEYFFVTSLPLSFYHDDAHQKVVFEELTAQSQNREYGVELHPYENTEIRIVYTGVIFPFQTKTIHAGGKEYALKWDSKEVTVPVSHLHWGDTFVIESEGECELTPGKMVIESSEKIGETYRYTLRFPGKESDFIFDPAEYAFDHGTLRFYYQEIPIEDKIQIIDGSRITYEAVDIEDGYRLPDGEHTILVDGENTADEIRNIRFYPIKDVEVLLPQPQFGGMIKYVLNGRELTGPKAVVPCGDSIVMSFVNWNGWISGLMDGTVYVIQDEASQSISFGDLGIDNIFTETEEHKPMLHVDIDRSIGEQTLFSVSASGLNIQEKHFVPMQMNVVPLDISKYSIADAQIGTEEPIVITVKHPNALNGYQIKAEIVKVDTHNHSESDIVYFPNRPYRFTYDLYPKETLTSTETVYKAVRITFSLVPVTRFRQHTVQNGSIEVQFADIAARSLLSGTEQLIDGNREVNVRLLPNDNFCVTGPSVNFCAFETTMKYSKYDSEKDFQKLLKEHPIVKIPKVTFDTHDDYGTCTFRVDSEIVSGESDVLPAQWVTATYDVTDPDYKLDMTELAYEDLTSYEVLNNNLAETWEGSTIRIDVTPEMDGKVIRCSDYFSVLRKGNKK